MRTDSLLGITALVVLILVVAALAESVRVRRRRADAAARRTARVLTSKVRLLELRRRLEAGEITTDAYEHGQQALVAGLLAATDATPTARWRPVPLGAGVLVLAAVVAGVLLLWARRAEQGREPADAQGGPAAVSSSAGDRDERQGRALSEEQLQRMIDQSLAAVKKTPDDAQSWAMLAHSYDMLGKFAESSKAYATLVKLLPNDAQVLADYADALAVTHGRTLAGEPGVLIEKALAIDPRNLKALALAGSAAFERKDFAEALAYWERALKASPDPAFREQIEGSIATTRAELGGGAATSTPGITKVATSGAASGAAVVAGRVTLADDLLAKASPDATVFVFARPAQDSRMPVAIMRKRVRDLPLDFVLDDSSSMVRDVKLSQVQTVVVGARVSTRGDVTPQPGDMQGWSAAVPVGTRGIRLEISEVLK